MNGTGFGPDKTFRTPPNIYCRSKNIIPRPSKKKTEKCINFQSPPPSLHSQCKYIHQLTRTVEPAIFQQYWNVKHPLTLSVRARALPPLLSTTTAPPASTGDLSVLLPTSAFLLFTYLVANFVVPRIILKDLQSDETQESGLNTSDDRQGSKPMGKT